MATIAQQKDKDNSVSPMGTASTSTGVTPVNVQNKPASSGQFTNVRSYLQANQGTGEKLANRVGQRVQSDVSQAKAKTEGEYAGVRDAVNAEKDRIANAGTQYANQIGTDATALTANDTTKQDVQNIRKGVNQLGTLQTNAATSAANAGTALTTAKTNVNNLGTETGRTSLLGQTFAKPTYSSGQRRLDQMLFQLGGANKINQLGKELGTQVGNVQSQQDTLASDITASLKAGGTAATEAAQKVTNAITGATGSLNEAQASELKKFVEEQAARNTALQSFFGQDGGVGNIDQAQLEWIRGNLKDQGLGLDTRTYNVLNDKTAAAKKYIQQGQTTGLTNADFIDANELARYNALAQLAEVDPTYAKVGSGGVSAGVKSDLKKDIDSARQSLLGRFANESMTGAGSHDYGQLVDMNTGNVFTGDSGTWNASPIGNYQGGTDYWSTSANKNALDLLKAYESGGPVSVSAQARNQDTAGYGKGGWGVTQDRTFDPIDLTLDRSGNIQGGTNMLGGSEYQQAASQLWNNFLQRLEQEGYNNTLGQIKAQNMVVK